ncbi:MAG: type 4a pilus biogenesis protein PilO [Pirellulales bacterium]|nr:type 4a pilus biogenesis protein PilO [Pirellulales bacterium]
MSTKSLQDVRPAVWMVHAAGAAVVVVAALAFYFGFFAPTAADMQERTARMDQLQLLMGSSEKIASDHRVLQGRLAVLRQAAASTRKRMPRRTSTQEFLESATQLAAITGMEMELCSAAAPQTHQTHTQVEVTCRMNGSYASVCRYLAAIDQLSQISKVSSLEVDTQTNSQAYPVHVTFQLYYRGQLHDTEVKRGGL